MAQGVHKLPSFYDAFWRFFASVRLAIVLIFLLAVTAVLGSLIQQEGQYPSSLPPEIYYPLEYGTYGQIMYALGLTRMYSSWWFLCLLLLLGVNLTVCSIDRFVPLIKTLRHPKVVRSRRFIATRPVYAQIRSEKRDEETIETAADVLRGNGFWVVREGSHHAYADKGRWGRYGPYVTHIGLMLMLLATLGMAVPGWYHDEFFWVEEGETVRVPHTDFVVRNDGFTVRFYEDGRPSFFQTDAVIIENGEEVHRHAIQVNNPLVYRRVNLFQASYEFQLGRTDFHLLRRDPDNPASESVLLGTLAIDVRNPAGEYIINETTVVRLLNYFPDFALDPVEGPVSLSSDPLNPAFVLEIVDLESEEPPVRQILFVLQPDFVLPGLATPYRFELADVDIVTRSGLISHKNLALPYIYAGLIITVVGIFLSFYLYHRRVWLLCQDGCLDIGAMSNKHPLSLEREMAHIIAQITDKLEGTLAVPMTTQTRAQSVGSAHVHG